MLSDFELKLYSFAKAEGFDSIDETNDVLLRHAIEWYLIEIIWKRTPCVKNLPSASPLILLLPQGADPEANVIDLVKANLDLNLYTLNDDRVENLVDHITKDNADALHQALEVEPELLHRRNQHMRSLLHEAVVQRKLWAAELLLNRGASLDQRTGSGFDTIELAIQSRFIGMMAPLLYQRVRQYIILRTMIAYHYAGSDCIDVYHARAQFAEPVTPAEEISLLHLAMKKRYFSLVKILVLNGASPNSPDSDGVMPLYNHAMEEIRYTKNNFNHRAQVVVPGFVSFLLAAGARPDQSSVDKKSLLADLRRETEQVHPSFAVAGAEIACQCQLAMGEFPIIILRKSDYNLLKEAGALVAKDVTYVVLENKNQLTLHYQKNGFPQMLAGHELLGGRVMMTRLHQFIALLYPELTSYQEKPFKSYVEVERRTEYLKDRYAKYIFDVVYEHAIFAQQVSRGVIKSQAMCWSELFKDQAQIIQCLESIYDGRPIRLDDELVYDMIEAAMQEKDDPHEIYEYVYSRLELNTTPENIKPFLYRSTRFVKSFRFKDSVVNQGFSGELTFRQILSEGGIALKENYAFKEDSIEREAYGWVKLAEQNKGAIDNDHSLVNPINSDKLISEVDILKGIKKVYLYKIKKTANHPEWKDTNVAIRDSLVLGSSTLFLNVIRTNSHMDQLKDTDTYLEVCKLMQTVELSDEAKAELSKRVQAKPDEASPRPSLRDVVMYLALACDFSKDKANFIRVCHDHLLSENVSAADQKSLNDALRLLSKEDHNQLRARLVAVSVDPSLCVTLKDRLPKKNCAFIEIIRTSEEDRKVINTKKFKELVEVLSKPMAEIAEKEGKKLTEKEWYFPTNILFFRPDPKKYSANLDMDDDKNKEGFFNL